MLPVLMGGVLISAILVALQFFLLFRSELGVMIATAVLAATAYLSTRSALSSLVVSMRYNLGIVSAEATLLYKEIS